MANESTVDSLIDGQGTGTGSAVTPSSSSSATVMMDLTGEGEGDSSSNSSSSSGSNNNSGSEGAFGGALGRPRSDSDYARELQAQWAAEDGQGQGLGQGTGLGETNQWGGTNGNGSDISNLVPNLIPTGATLPTSIKSTNIPS